MSLGNALGYLTVLPIPRKKSIPLLRSVHFFPLVGVGMGSLAVLFFVAARHYLPDAVACFLVVAGIEVLSGGATLHGLAEMAQGRKTYPGHGFDPGFKLETRGSIAIAAVVVVKTASLISLSLEWQTHAVFVLPVLGRCTQTLAFILSPHRLARPHATDPKIARRKVRAGFWSITLLLLLFLFPLRMAIPALALYAVVVLWGLKRCNTLFHGLTLQAVSLLSELSEAMVLVLLAVIAKGWT